MQQFGPSKPINDQLRQNDVPCYSDIQNWISAVFTSQTKITESKIQRIALVERGLHELNQLLNGQNFYDAFLAVELRVAERPAIEINRKIESQLFRLILQTECIKKLAPDERKTAVRSIMKDEANKSFYLRQLQDKNKQLFANLELAEKLLSESKKSAIEQINTLRNQPSEKRWSKDLQKAIEVWGRSRNLSDANNYGEGYHAGVVHYFEYRCCKWKTDRFPTPASFTDFIDLSFSLGKLIRPTDIEDLKGIRAALLVEDDQGQQRVIIYTEDNLKLVGFRKTGQPMRLLTYYPSKADWLKQDNLRREVEKLTDSANDTRFNRLGYRRRLVASIGLDLA